MTESRWVSVARGELIPPREGRSVQIDDREIAIFNVVDPSTKLGAGGTFLAIDRDLTYEVSERIPGAIPIGSDGKVIM